MRDKQARDNTNTKAVRHTFTLSVHLRAGQSVDVNLQGRKQDDARALQPFLSSAERLHRCLATSSREGAPSPLSKLIPKLSFA